MKKPILKEDVRILRPSEYDQLRDAIPKMHHQIFLDTLLYSGMRYIEVQRFQDHPEWYEKETRTIHIPKEGGKKKKRTMKDRYVHLNQSGSNTVSLFFKLDQDLPARATWYQDLQRWGEYTRMDTNGLCAKMTRKTWESWLLTAYPKATIQVCMSMGHTKLTAMEHYLNLPFTDSERKEIIERVAGWGGL